ncbi:MAG: hypothetical protein ACYDDQ_05315 [Vulcanimicrobiaceae bacterium]
MDFELLDRYLLDRAGNKAEVVADLLAHRSSLSGAAPFYEGFELLGARTPDLALLALRLVLAGQRADDDAVADLRRLMERARGGGEDGARARADYFVRLR